MHQLLNTLYVQTPRSYLHLDHETLKVKLEGETRLQVPLLPPGRARHLRQLGVRGHGDRALVHFRVRVCGEGDTGAD